MHEVNRWALAGTILLAQCLGISMVHYWFGDDLLFQSDLWSLFTYLGAATLVTAPVLLLPALLVRYIPRAGRFLERAFLLGFALLLVMAFEIALLRNVFEISLQRYHLIPIFLLSGLAVFFGAERNTLLQRIEKLGWLGLVLLGVGAPLCVGWNHLTTYLSGGGQSDGKHLIYIVLDAFPAQYLNSYNPAAPTTTMDVAFQDAQILRGVRTTTPYTNSYFGTFYTGKLNQDSEPQIAEGNLFAALQKNGVASRWISFHRNGYPECCAAAIHDYSGLRSYFLSENFCWIPQTLGIHYHVTINRPSAKSVKGRQKRRYALATLLNGERRSPFENAFTEFLIPQTHELRRHGKDTMMVFHFDWYGIGRDLKGGNLGGQELVDEEKSELIAAARKNDSRYPPEFEPLAADMRQASRERMEALGARYQEFLSALRADPRLKDTTVIVTADHGSIYGKGRFFYGFHPNQEVVQVLCAVSRPQPQPRVDDRLFSTPDLTASVLDYFGLRSSFRGEAHSIFADGPGRAHTATLTLNSEQWKEWWLVLVKGETKRWINLNPAGNGETLSYPAAGYEETPLAASPGATSITEEDTALIHSSLRDFGVPPEAVHAAFREKTVR